MEREKQEFMLAWEGIEIKVSYCPDYGGSYLRHRLAHLEIESMDRERLPMTETGYRSCFAAASAIENHGSPVDFVRAWLEEAAQEKAWKEHRKSRALERQLTLF